MSPSMHADPEPDEPDAQAEVEVWAFRCWLDLGFDPLEALALVAEGLSPSEVREFVRHHECSPHDAVAILL